MSCVYRLTFPDESVYIGRTDGNPEDRWRGGWGYDPSSMVFKSIFYFGWANVKKEILEDGLTHEEAKNSEKNQITVHSALCTVINNYDNPAHSFDSNHQFDPDKAHAEANYQLLNRNTKDGYLLRKNNKFIIPLVPKPYGSYRCPIDVFNLAGEYLYTYPNAKVASQELNVTHGSITSCCKGERGDGQKRYQAGGYIFRYHNPEFWGKHKNEDTE